MALKIQLLLNKPSYFPAESVQASVQVANDPDPGQPYLPVHIKELSFSAFGTERTDPSFVQRLHRPEVPAEKLEARKRLRTIFSTEPTVLATEHSLATHTSQQFLLRFRLPSVLPPTFKGSSVRFSYTLEVRATYEVAQESKAAVVYETTASAALLIWPGSGTPMPARRASIPDSKAAGVTGLQKEASLPNSRGNAREGQSTPVAAAGPPSGAFGSSSSATNANSSQAGTGAAGSSTITTTTTTNTASGAAAASSTAGPPTEDSDLALIDYKLSKGVSQLRWQQLGVHTLGTDLMSTPSFTHASTGSLLTPNSSAAVLSPLSPAHLASIHSPTAMAATSTTYAASSYDSDDDVGSLGGRPSNPGSDLQRHVQRQASGGGAYARAARKASVFGRPYALNVGDQPLLRVMLQAPLDTPLQPGATFGGVLDLRAGQAVAAAAAGGSGPAPVRPGSVCHNVVVMLESEEVVSPECRAANKLRLLPGSSSAASPFVIRKLHAEHHEMTSDVAVTSFTFTLPNSATPSFRTPLVSLRWVLRFEFTVGPPVDFSMPDRKLGRVALDQLVWTLPLVVRPPSGSRG